MNEPNSMPTDQWVAAANAAIAGIRAAGATNLIHVPGNQWTGAHAWTANYYGTPNSVAMLNIVDPASNHVFEVHQYLDSDSSGTSTNIVNANIGVTRLSAFTSWLRANNKRGFLGEFAVANSTIGGGATQIGDEALTNMLSYIAANSDVWEGWAWWAAGPWWGSYMFTLEPTNLGQPGQTDRAAMPCSPQFHSDSHSGAGGVEQPVQISLAPGFCLSTTNRANLDGPVGESGRFLHRQWAINHADYAAGHGRQRLLSCAGDTRAVTWSTLTGRQPRDRSAAAGSWIGDR
jgi:hypothetical protein